MRQARWREETVSDPLGAARYYQVTPTVRPGQRFAPTSSELQAENEVRELRRVFLGIDALSHDITESPWQDAETIALKLRGRNGWAYAKFRAIEDRQY